MLQYKTIVISGTPGTGKSSLAKLIAGKTNFKVLNFKNILKENKLNENYDSKRKCYVIDIKKLNNVLIKLIKNSKNNLIIDSHLGHFLPKKYVNLCIITKCDLKLLKKRLMKRKYNSLKIKEIFCIIYKLCRVVPKITIQLNTMYPDNNLTEAEKPLGKAWKG